jgi:hypothetical protein
LGALARLYETYADRVAFFLVYVREAHPEDGWVLADNRRQGIAIDDPADAAARGEVAAACAGRYAIDIPVLVDDVDDAVARRYGGWPDRLALIGRDRRIAYIGGPGPSGFVVSELEDAIARELG